MSDDNWIVFEIIIQHHQYSIMISAYHVWTLEPTQTFTTQKIKNFPIGVLEIMPHQKNWSSQWRRHYGVVVAKSKQNSIVLLPNFGGFDFHFNFSSQIFFFSFILLLHFFFLLVLNIKNPALTWLFQSCKKREMTKLF